MKKAILLLTAIMHTTGLLAQIPNAGFENWDTIAGVSKLIGWEVPNYATANDTFEWAKPDTLSGSGKYSVYISNEPRAGFEPVIGTIRTYFKISKITDTLLLNINIPDPMPMSARPAVRISSRGLIPPEQVDVLYDTNFTNGFQLWKIPFNFSGIPDSVYLQIQVGSERGYTNGAYIDQILLNSTLATEENIFQVVDFYPNPVHDLLHLSGNISLPVNYKIINTNGAIMQHGVLENQQLSLAELPPGIYFLQMEVEGKWQQSRLVKE